MILLTSALLKAIPEFTKHVISSDEMKKTDPHEQGHNPEIR